jgi:spore germination protein GerM
VATKSNNRKKSGAKGKIPAGLLFWPAFLIVIAALFIINWPVIQNTVRNVFNQNNPIETNPDTQAENQELVEIQGLLEHEGATRAGGTLETPPSVSITGGEETAENENPSPATQTTSGNTQERTPAKTIRTVYFVQIDNSGMILMNAVSRAAPVSVTPLSDALSLLLAGPDTEEGRRGINSLIPAGTKVLQARVQGATATINFNENFMFNDYGAEGYIAQLRQVVWTATEFPNVKDVQILIEGRKVDFLGENIRIGTPIGRSSL